jgi:hypothetical protein
MTAAVEPLVTFYQLIQKPAAPHLSAPRLPSRATFDANGTLPANALRYCEPVRAASAFGYHLYLPMEVGLLFNGSEISWSFDHDGSGIGIDWWPLDAAHYPNFLEDFNRIAPDYLKDFAPPFLATGESHGNVQVWTGAIARTRRDWSLLMRGPVNDSRRSLGYEVLEGIIETDEWGGHLFTNIKLLRTDTPIILKAHQPFAQAIPLHRAHYADDLLNAYDVSIDAIPEDVWKAYADVVVGKHNGSSPLGDYIVKARRRRAREQR